MGIIVKIVLGLTAMASMFLSSLGFKNDNFLTGFIFVIVAIIALIFLLRFLWEIIGCAMTMALIAGLIGIILYISGAFSEGSISLPDSISSLLGGKKEPQPNQTLYGKAVALSGDVININNKNYYLYGTAAPRLDQVCSTKTGSKYKCGMTSKDFLQEKIQGQEPVCTVLGSASPKGNMLPAICNVGEYDLGALMVAGGWSIPDFSNGMVYAKYETEAKKRGLGLWQGKFSSPWQWEKIKQDQQQRLQSIKIEKPKKEQSLLMKNFWN